MSIRSIAGVLAAGLWLAMPADADLYRCVGSDGTASFTDDASRCPGARPHEARGEVQSIPIVEPPGAASASQARVPLEREINASEEAVWRGKKAASERELAELDAALERLTWALTKCNRGNKLYVRDADGMKSGVDCVEIRQRHGQTKAQHQKVQAYLNGGLVQECRQAGCLPGWVR